MKVSNGQLELMKRDRIILGSRCGNRACSLAGVQQEFVQDYQSLDLMLKTYKITFIKWIVWHCGKYSYSLSSKVEKLDEKSVYTLTVGQCMPIQRKATASSQLA